MKTKRLSQGIWQERVERLYQRIELNELLKFIDFEKPSEKFIYPDLGVNTKPVHFPALEGIPKETAFYKKIFGIKRGRAVISHGHSNMASEHFVLKGKFELKHYEKLREEKDHLVIKPTIDRTIQPGDYSTISDDRDNVHWFIATSETAFTFDVIMADLNEKKYEIHNVDIDEGERLSNELVWVPKLDVNKALKKYGKDHPAGAVATLR